MIVTNVILAEETKAENAASAASIREQIDAGFEATSSHQASVNAFMTDIRAWQARVDDRMDGMERAADS